MRASISDKAVLIVVGTLTIGGTERHLTMVARGLVSRGWNMSVYSLAGTGPLHRVLEEAGVQVVVPPMPHGGLPFPGGRVLRLMITAVHLLAVLVRRRFALVHFFLPEAYIVGASAAILARVPVRVMSRRSLNLYQRKFPAIGYVERWLHRTMNAVLGNSRAVVNELRYAEGVPPQKLGLIYNGCALVAPATPDARLSTRTGLGLAPDTLVMLSVANLIPYKGHADILDALAIARPKLPNDWRLLLAGRDDGIGPALKARAEQLGIADNVVFLGSRDDVPALLGAADIGLLCSHEEGFSNAVLEGMSARLAMIVTDVGGNPEAVIDNECGLVVPPKQPAALAAAILRVANDANLRERFACAGRARVEAFFSLPHCIEQYDSLYRALLAGQEPASVPSIRVSD